MHESDEGSLSQHPLAQETMTSEGESALTPGDADADAQAADVSHITSGSRSTQPDAASQLLYRELLSQSNKSTPQMSEGGASVTGSECDAAEQSYLGFPPHSESAAAVAAAAAARTRPAESAVKSGRLSVIPSSDENSQQGERTSGFVIRFFVLTLFRMFGFHIFVFFFFREGLLVFILWKMLGLGFVSVLVLA